jgi:hypothetical protein
MAVRCRPKCAVATPAITTGTLSPRKEMMKMAAMREPRLHRMPPASSALVH